MSEALRFLTALCGLLLPDEDVEIRTFHRGGDQHGKPGPRRFGADAAALAAFVTRLSGGLDVYYGINPRRRGRGGKKDAVSRLRFIQQDIDHKHFADGAAGAVRALNDFPLPPTLVIQTGGGLQGLWMLTEPLALTGPEDPQIAAVEGMTARMARAMGNLDSTQDASRVFRLPGSRNYKYPEAPEVVLRHEDWGAAYSLDEFAALLPAPATPQRGARAPLPHDDASTDELREMLRHVDPQPGYADWMRVVAAVHSAFPGPEGLAIAEEWSPGYAGEIEEKFRSFGRYRGVRGQATLGTIVYLAKRGGWRPPMPTFAFSGPAPGVAASTVTEAVAVPPDPALVEYLSMSHEELARRAYRAERFNRAYLRFDKNPSVKTQKPTIRAVLFEYDNLARAGRVDAEGWAPSSLAALGEGGGGSKDAAGDHLKEIAAWGVGIEKDVRDEEYRVPVANGGEIIQKRPRLYIKVDGDVVDKLEELAVFAPPKREGKNSWGGKREPCPRCGSTKTRTVTYCGGCDRILQEMTHDGDEPLPEAITPADLQDVLRIDEPDADAPSIPPIPVAVPVPPATYPLGQPVYVAEEESEEQDDWDPSECNAPACTRRIDPALHKRYCRDHEHLGLAPDPPPVRPPVVAAPAPALAPLDPAIVADEARRHDAAAIAARLSRLLARREGGEHTETLRRTIADWRDIAVARAALDAGGA